MTVRTQVARTLQPLGQYGEGPHGQSATRISSVATGAPALLSFTSNLGTHCTASVTHVHLIGTSATLERRIREVTLVIAATRRQRAVKTCGASFRARWLDTAAHRQRALAVFRSIPSLSSRAPTDRIRKSVATAKFTDLPECLEIRHVINAARQPRRRFSHTTIGRLGGPDRAEYDTQRGNIDICIAHGCYRGELYTREGATGEVAPIPVEVASAATIPTVASAMQRAPHAVS